MSRQEVAALAGVPLDQVHVATAAELIAAYGDSAPQVVIEVGTQEHADYWRVGTRYYLDDPSFGPPCPIDDLRYSHELGLYDVRGFGEDR